MATTLKYFEGSKTLQKQKGYFIANSLGGPLDVTSWVLYKDNLTDVPNKYVGKRVYVLSEDEVYYYNGTQWRQIYNVYRANTVNYKTGNKNISSKYLLKFYNLGVKSDYDEPREIELDNGSDEKIIIAREVPSTGVKDWVDGMTAQVGDIIRFGNFYAKCTRETKKSPFLRFLFSNGDGVSSNNWDRLYANLLNTEDYEAITCMIRASLIVPTKYSDTESFYIEYPYLGGDEGGKLYYKWYRNSFDNKSLIQQGYENTWIPNYSNDILRTRFDEKILCEIYIETKNGKILVAKNSCHIISEPQYNSITNNNSKSKGLVYMDGKVQQIPRGQINTNHLATGMDAGFGVEAFADLGRIPTYFGKRVYVHDYDSFYIYKLRDRLSIPDDNISMEDKLRKISSHRGSWVKIDDSLNNVVTYDNNSNLTFTIDRMDVTDVSIENPLNNRTDVPYWGYRKMSYTAHLDMDFHNQDSSLSLDKLHDIARSECNYNPVTAEYYGTNVKVHWTVSVRDSGGENYHDIVPGDNPSREESVNLILPTKEENIKDYYGNPIVTDLDSFKLEFGITNDVYDKEIFDVRCDITFNAEGNVQKTLTKNFNFTLERKSYIDFGTMKMTEITPLEGKFEVDGLRYDFKDDQPVISDASAFYALDNTIGLRYKVFYTASDNTASENNWVQLDSTYINFYQDDTHKFHFTRKGSLPSEMISMIGGSQNDNGKLPFGYYRIVPFINDVMFNLKYNQSEGIKDISMFQEITKFSLRTSTYGEDEYTGEDIGQDLGNWYRNLDVSYGDTVRQNGDVFRCINKNGATGISPLKMYKTNSDETLQYKDNGYVLEGGINTDYYTFDKTAIQVGYFDATKVTSYINPDIKEWFDLAYPKPLDRGEWYDGLDVRYRDIVEMDGSTFQCINPNGTKNCPLVRFQTNTGRVLLFSDGAYVMTGEYNSEDYTTNITVTPSTDFEPEIIYKDTLCKYEGNYYKCIKDTTERPYKVYATNGGERLKFFSNDYVLTNEFNSEYWKTDRVERFKVTDGSKSTPKDLVIYGTIRGTYIDMNKFSLVSDSGRSLSYSVVESESEKMTQDNAYYSKVVYKIIFKDNSNRDVEKETATLLYATSANPMANQKTVTNQSFVYHPFTSPEVLDVDSGWKLKDGSDIFIAGTNKYSVRYNDVNNIKVQYKNEKNETLDLDRQIKYYVDNVKIEPEFPTLLPDLTVGGIVEARMNFDATGIYGSDSNYVGLKMPYPIYEIDFDFVFEDGLEFLVYPYTPYLVDLKVRKNANKTNKVWEKIDHHEYTTKIWSKENDLFVNGINVKNNPITLGGESFYVQFHSAEQLRVDIYAEVSMFGGYKMSCEKVIPIQTVVPEHKGTYSSSETITECEMIVTEENLSVGSTSEIKDLVNAFRITFKDGVTRVYTNEYVERMIDSGRVTFRAISGCKLVNNKLTATSIYPKIGVKFNGWDDSRVDVSAYLNYYPEIDFIGFREESTSNISPIDFELDSSLNRFDEGSEYLTIYAGGKNLKTLFKNSECNASLGMMMLSSIGDTGQKSIEKSWKMDDVSSALFNFNGFVTDSEMSSSICRFSYKKLKNRLGEPITKEDVGFALSDKDRKSIGFIRLNPVVNLNYKRSDGGIIKEKVEFSNESNMARLIAKVEYDINVFANGNAIVTGSGRYVEDSSAVLTVEPYEGYTFRRWMKNSKNTKESVCDTSTFELIVTEDASYFARILPKDTAEFTVNCSSDTTMGTVLGNGFYTSDDDVSIKAVPKTDYEFIGWYENEKIVTSVNPLDLKGNKSDINYVAQFKEDRMSVSITGDGSVWETPPEDYPYGRRLYGEKENNVTKIDTIVIESSKIRNIEFYYKINTEERYDKLYITVNGTEILNGISGEVTDVTSSVELNSGSNTIIVKYTKDVSITKGDDYQYYAFKIF